MVRRKHSSQEEIFATYDWWNEASVLKQITGDRCDYIATCVDKVFGHGAVAQQDMLEVGSGGGLICEEMVRHGATMIGLDPSQGALAAALRLMLAAGPRLMLAAGIPLYSGRRSPMSWSHAAATAPSTFYHSTTTSRPGSAACHARAAFTRATGHTDRLPVVCHTLA